MSRIQLKSDAKAVASGVREGWSRDKPLDVNNANKAQLESFSGIRAEGGQDHCQPPLWQTGGPAHYSSRGHDAVRPHWVDSRLQMQNVGSLPEP